MLPERFTCDECDESKPVPNTGVGTGFGRDDKGRVICYSCCGKLDLERMKQDGKAVLYLSTDHSKVGNWPDSLSFKVTHIRTGRHNIARKRYDVWFWGPDRHKWHGVQYGDNTQLCHAKRTQWKFG